MSQKPIGRPWVALCFKFSDHTQSESDIPTTTINSTCARAYLVYLYRAANCHVKSKKRRGICEFISHERENKTYL